MLLFITFLPSVSAQFEDNPLVQEGDFPQGLIVEYPKFTVHGLNENLTLSFHVYNSSDGSYMSTGTSCSLNLYRGITGNQVFVSSTPTFTAPNVFTFQALGGNFSTNNQYGFVAQCNTTTTSGFASGSFAVTPNGEQPTVAKAIFYMGLMFVLLFFLSLMFVAHFRDESELGRFWWFSFMWIPIWAILFIGWNMANDFLTSQGAIKVILYWCWLLIAIIYPFFLLGLVLYTFYYIYKRKEVQDLVNRGFSLEDAEAKSNGSKRGGY